MIQDVRGYWNNRPCNVRHSSVDIDRNPLLFSVQVSSRKYLVEPHIPGFASFGWARSRSVLELGCGIGTDTLSFAAHGARIVAIDISEKSLEIARKRAMALSLGQRIRFVQGNIEKLGAVLAPLAKQGAFIGEMHKYKYGSRDRCPSLHTFDLVYSFGVLHHTPHPERVLQQAKHYMRPDSYLKIMVYNRWSWKALRILFKYGVKYGKLLQWKELIAQYSEAQTGCPITRTYTKREIKKLLWDCGFEVVGMEIDHIFPYRIEDYIEHRYAIEWWWKLLPQKLFRWLEKRIGWHLLVVAKPRGK